MYRGLYAHHIYNILMDEKLGDGEDIELRSIAIIALRTISHRFWSKSARQRLAVEIGTNHHAIDKASECSITRL